MLEFSMTYVDDDDFDDFEAEGKMDDDLEEDEASRCDECGLRVKKDDAIVCPACTAQYHRWCVTECNRCNTPLNAGEQEAGAGPVKASARKGAARAAAPKMAAPKMAAPKMTAPKKKAVKAASAVRAPRAR